jgi:DnaJ homolog subfamily C member 28
MPDPMQSPGAARPAARQTEQADVIQRARAKAAEYANPTPPAPTDDDPVQTMEEWADLVSQRIEEAIRHGLFDNLPGRGKPLELRRDPYVPEDQQMAHTLLRNNNLVPAWISERKAVLAAIERLRAKLAASAGFARQELANTQDEADRTRLAQAWSRWKAEWQREIAALNKRIVTLNLQQPADHLEVYQLRLEDELARAGARQDWFKV